MERTTVLLVSGSQSVLLPASVAFPDSVTVVDVIALGRARLITPADNDWQSWFDGVGVSDDFLSSRDQPD